MQVAVRSVHVSSALVVRMRLFQQSDVGEGEMASFAFALTLPLAVHVDLGHFHHVSHLFNDKEKHDECWDWMISLSAQFGLTAQGPSFHARGLTEGPQTDGKWSDMDLLRVS